MVLVCMVGEKGEVCLFLCFKIGLKTNSFFITARSFFYVQGRGGGRRLLLGTSLSLPSGGV